MKEMKFLILFTVFLFNILVHSFAQVQNKIDYPSFFSRQDLVFDTLSTQWEEGAFIGNGLLGVMIYREDKNALRFDMGRTDVVDHREGINPSLGKARLPIGRFILRPEGNIKSIHLKVDLWNAEVSGRITTEKGEIDLQALVLRTADVILCNTKTSKGEKNFKWEWKPELSKSPFAVLRDSTSEYQPNPKNKLSKENDIHYNYQPLLVGGSYTTAWRETVNENQKSLFVTIGNSYPEDNSRKVAVQILTEVLKQDQKTLIDAHRNKWYSFYKESFISIPDSRLESFYWIQQYKMASATREGAFPIDLMGPWYRITPWPKYWWNLNVQLTYYPFFSSNHLDLTRPLIKMINDHRDNLSKNVPEPYQHNSYALGRSGPYDMTSGIKVLKLNTPEGNNPASLELGNLTWLLHVYWQAYEYSRDEEILKSLYPILTGSINYYIHIMEKGNDGKWHLPYTYSPEYPDGVSRDNNYDLSLLRWGCATLLFINDHFKRNDPLAEKWKDILVNLTSYPVDELGLKIGRDASFEKSHRHYSHLLMIYPIHSMNWDQKENRALIEKSLKTWENNNSSWRGYSYTGSGSIYATMGNGNKSLQLLNEMMDKGKFSIKPNTMYLEAGPVIETPLSAVNTINELLLQDWNGMIRVFPAVPDTWKEASFHDLRAKGAFLVSASRKNGKTQFIRIKSMAGEPCIVKTGWETPVKTEGSRKFNLVQEAEGILKIDLKKGEEVILYKEEKPTSFTIAPVEPDKKQNYWGLKK